MLYVLRDLPAEEQAQAIYQMRTDIRKKHPDIRLRTDIIRDLWLLVEAAAEGIDRKEKRVKKKGRRTRDDQDDDSTYILRMRGGTEFEHIPFARSVPARRIHRPRNLNKRMEPLHFDPSVPPRYFGSAFLSLPHTLSHSQRIPATRLRLSNGSSRIDHSLVTTTLHP